MGLGLNEMIASRVFCAGGGRPWLWRTAKTPHAGLDFGACCGGISDGTAGRVSCPPARGASDDAHGYNTFGTTLDTHWGDNRSQPSRTGLAAGLSDSMDGALSLSSGLALRTDSAMTRGFADATTTEVVVAMGRVFRLDSSAHELFDVLPRGPSSDDSGRHSDVSGTGMNERLSPRDVEMQKIVYELVALSLQGPRPRGQPTTVDAEIIKELPHITQCDH